MLGEVSLEISPSDEDAVIALKMASYGYRAASWKHHPDHGGSSEIMKKPNAARERARKRLDTTRVSALCSQGLGWKRIAAELGVGVGTLYRLAGDGSKIPQRVF